MNKARILKLERQSDGLPLCVGCLKTEGCCTHPAIEGTKRCGKEREDLPDFLFVGPAQAASPYSALSPIERRERIRELSGRFFGGLSVEERSAKIDRLVANRAGGS